jgi:cation transport ATPase
MAVVSPRPVRRTRRSLGSRPAGITCPARAARATFRTIRRNLSWAFYCNPLALPVAAAGFLNPLAAAAAMTLSSVFVVWNSLRLRGFAGTPVPELADGS